MGISSAGEFAGGFIDGGLVVPYGELDPNDRHQRVEDAIARNKPRKDAEAAARAGVMSVFEGKPAPVADFTITSDMPDLVQRQLIRHHLKPKTPAEIERLEAARRQVDAALEGDTY